MKSYMVSYIHVGDTEVTDGDPRDVETGEGLFGLLVDLMAAFGESSVEITLHKQLELE